MRCEQSRAQANLHNFKLKLLVVQVADIQEAFKLFDKDNSGSIDYRELKARMKFSSAALKALGFPAKKADVQAKMAQYDKEETGKINEQQFQMLLTDAMLSKDPAELLSRAFQLFDTQNNGKISADDLRLVANELGHEVEEQDLIGMIEEFDRNHDGIIDAEEFQHIMSSSEAY
ncbi:MAG: centrin-3 [Trebouxia sp. A1-2]|nr:MAG: centrin-3 [Trebouxia sp. A1-2]